MNKSFIPLPFLAETSSVCNFNSFARFSACYLVTFLLNSHKYLELLRSVLFPTRIPGACWCSMNILYQILTFSSEDATVTSYTKTTQCAFLRYVGIKLRYLYCPAVSHIWSLYNWPFLLRSLTLKSIPTVGFISS